MQNQRTGALLRKLRQERGWTQRQVAEQLGVSTQAVSKWERDQGIPDVGLLPHLAEIFGVSVEGLLDGGLNPAAPDGGNMKRLQFYVCPDCGNILTSSSGGQLSCCGRKLEPLRAVPADAEHAVTVQEVETDWYVTFRHPMEKGHFIRFAPPVWRRTGCCWCGCIRSRAARCGCPSCGAAESSISAAPATGCLR